MKKSTLIMALALILSLALGVGGTLAYLTDRDSETNIFTVGNVDIDLTEDFTQGEQLLPGKDVTKIPTIKNEGTTDAWVWMTVAIPANLENVNGDPNLNALHWNFLSSTVDTEKYAIKPANVEKHQDKGWLDAETAAEDIRARIAAGDYWTHKDVSGVDVQKNVTIEGAAGEYNVYTFKYASPLTPGEETLAGPLVNVFLDAHVDIAPNGDMYRVENGEVTHMGWNIENSGNPTIFVAAYAVQAEGFDTVEEAYEAYGEQWGENGGVKYNTETKQEVRQGYIPPVEGGVIENLIISDNSGADVSARAIYNDSARLEGDLTINNSYLDGTYAMNLYGKAGAGVDFVANNTTFAGWTSTDGNFDSVTFNNCTFKLNSEGTYNNIQAHLKYVLNNCELKGTTLTVDGGSFELVNCTFNGVALTSLDQLPEGSDTSAITITVE